jgi:hypothetical protein
MTACIVENDSDPFVYAVKPVVSIFANSVIEAIHV